MKAYVHLNLRPSELFQYDDERRHQLPSARRRAVRKAVFDEGRLGDDYLLWMLTQGIA